MISNLNNFFHTAIISPVGTYIVSMVMCGAFSNINQESILTSIYTGIYHQEADFLCHVESISVIHFVAFAITVPAELTTVLDRPVYTL